MKATKKTESATWIFFILYLYKYNNKKNNAQKGENSNEKTNTISTSNKFKDIFQKHQQSIHLCDKQKDKNSIR